MEFYTHVSDIYIVIPAMNEEKFIEGVINKILSLGFENIVVVNDNSSDSTREKVDKYKEYVTVLDHFINMGAGAATKTGIDYAVSKGAKLIATIDADHQHNPEDLIPLISCLEAKDVDLVIGSRFLKRNEIPWTRLFFNLIGNIFSFFITGIVITDSQSGMKVMSRRFAENLSITYNGYEFCIEIIKNAQITRSKIYEYPIDVRYTKDTMNKGQNVFTGFNMIGRFLNPFKG